MKAELTSESPLDQEDDREEHGRGDFGEELAVPRHHEIAGCHDPDSVADGEVKTRGMISKQPREKRRSFAAAGEICRLGLSAIAIKLFLSISVILIVSRDLRDEGREVTECCSCFLMLLLFTYHYHFLIPLFLWFARYHVARRHSLTASSEAQ